MFILIDEDNRENEENRENEDNRKNERNLGNNIFNNDTRQQLKDSWYLYIMNNSIRSFVLIIN